MSVKSWFDWGSMTLGCVFLSHEDCGWLRRAGQLTFGVDSPLSFESISNFSSGVNFKNKKCFRLGCPEERSVSLN